MILLDYSQTVIGSFMAMGRGKPVVEEDLLKQIAERTERMILQIGKLYLNCYMR